MKVTLLISITCLVVTMFMLSSGAEHNSDPPLNHCRSFVGTFSATLHGTYLSGTTAGKIHKRMFGVDTRANWCKQSRTKYRVGMRRQFVCTREVMFWCRLSVVMPALARQTKSRVLKDQNVSGKGTVAILHVFQVLLIQSGLQLLTRRNHSRTKNGRRENWEIYFKSTIPV